MKAIPDRFAYVRRYAFHGMDTIIRRYLQPGKFLDLITTGELHFAPASRMSDPKEGFITSAEERHRVEHLRRIGFPSQGISIARDAWHTVASENAKAVVLSCWSMGSAEDPRMWTEYAPSPEAVAIETTVHAMERALGADFLAVPVRYLVGDTELLPNATLDTLEPFFFKREQFQWERELRFIGPMEMGKQRESPRRVKLQPSQIPLRFVVAPGAPAERLEEVRALLEKWEPGLEVRASTLMKR